MSSARTLGTSSDGETSPRVQIIDLTGDSDDDNTRQAMDEDEMTETISGARAIIDLSAPTARITSRSVAIAEPPVAVAVLQRIVAEQDTARVPAFRKARDGTTQDMDTLSVRRVALHAHQWRALTSPVDAPSAVDAPSPDALTFSGVRASPADDPSMVCSGADANTLLTLEHVSPLVQSRSAAFESGDAYGFSDTFEFVVDATRVGGSTTPRSRADIDHVHVVNRSGADPRRTRAMQRANDTLDSAARYQHTMAFSGGRYEIAPPVAELHAANLVQTETDVRNTLDRFTNALNRDAVTRGALLTAAARYGIVDALRAGATPRLFTQALVPLGELENADDAARFNAAYRVMLIRGKPRFLYRVLSATLEQARANGAMRAATNTSVRTTPHFGATLASADTGAELGGVGAQDSAPIDALSATDVRRLTRLRVLVDYERLLLEVNDVVRAEVSGDDARDTPFIVSGAVVEYDMLDPIGSLLRGKCGGANPPPLATLDEETARRVHAWLQRRTLRVPASSEARIAELFPSPVYDAKLDALSNDLGVARRRRDRRHRRHTVVPSDVLRREGRQQKRARVPTTEARANEAAQEEANARRKELRNRKRAARELGARTQTTGGGGGGGTVPTQTTTATTESTPFSDVAMFGTTLSKGRVGDSESDSLTDAIDVDALVGVEPKEGEDIEGEVGADPEQLERELADEQYANGGISTALRADIHSVGVLDRNYSQPMIAVPLGWSAHETLIRVHKFMHTPRSDEARATMWRTDWRLWRGILELALFAKLVPCSGPLFGNDAHETLQLSLELVAERVSRERTFAETNTKLFVAERRLELTRAEGGARKSRANIRRILELDSFPDALAHADTAASVAYVAEIEALDANVAAAVRNELTQLRAFEGRLTADDDVPRDSLPSILAVRVAPPDAMRYIDALSTERIVGEQLEPADRAAFAFVLASVAQRPVSAADIFNTVPLVIDDDDLRPLPHYYPLANTYGSRDALVPLLNDRDDALNALSRYTSLVPTAQSVLDAPVASGIHPSRIGTALASLYEKTRESPQAASALAIAVFPYLDPDTHNRLVQVHLAPPEIGTLTARRRQFAQLRDAFNDFGKPDTSKIATAVARREGELRARAQRVMEERGSERLTAASAQAYVLEHSAAHTHVYDQTPRVKPNFQLLPNDDVAPIGVFEAVGRDVLVNQQRTTQLLLSDVALGGLRVQIASVRQRADIVPTTPIPFFYACAPHVTALIAQRVAEDDAARDTVRAVARDFHSAYVAAYAGERGVTARNASLDDYATWRTLLDTFAAQLLRVTADATVRFAADVDDDGVADGSYRSFVNTAAAALGDQVRPALMLVDSERTRADRLVTLPFSGLAALERASSDPRRALRTQLHQAWYRVSLELRFQRLGYQYAPFNSSRLALLPTRTITAGREPLYGNAQTLHIALRAYLREFMHSGEEIDSEGESASGEASGDDSSTAADPTTEVDTPLAPYTERTSAALELRTLLNRLETEATTLHTGRTLWFELAALHMAPTRFVSEVSRQLVTLWDAVRDGRRIALIAPLSSTGAETGLGASRPLPFDPRAERLVRERWQPYAAFAALDSDEDEQRNVDEDALRKFWPVIDSVVDHAVTKLGAGIEFRAEPSSTTIEELSAADLLRAELAARAEENLEIEFAKTEREVRIARAIARARERELHVSVRDVVDSRFNFGLDDTEALTLQRTDDEAARAALERRELVSEQYDVPLCSLKRVSADGIRLVQQLASDARIRVARRRQMLAHFVSRDAMLAFLTKHRSALLRAVGEAAPLASSGKKQRLIRDAVDAARILRVLLDDVLRALIDERIALRRDAVLTLAGESRSQHRGVSVELMRTAALSVLSRQGNAARFYRMQLAPVDVAALQVLIADMQAVELAVVSEQLEQSLGSTMVPTVVGGGAVRVMIEIPTLYVHLLSSAAIERARITLQQAIESGSLGEFHAQRKPYALAHRADAHPALRIDELVRRFALTGELPLAADNDQYAPYAQYIAARSPEAQRTGVAALGRVRAFGGRLESLRKYALAPRYVSLGEGEHRTHASGADVQMSALAVHLLCAYGAVHGDGARPIASLYRETQLRAPDAANATRAIARHPTPLVRLWAHLVLFFGEPHKRMRSALAREFGIINEAPLFSMPVLRDMRPIDLRLLVLVLLGFDTAARTDVSPNSRDDASSASPPLMPPAYTHMRTVASKLLLADAYYTALLDSLYTGFTNPRLFAVRRDDGTVAVAIAEHDDTKYTQAAPVFVLTREQHRALYRERLRDATLTEVGATRIKHARFTRLVAEPLAVQIASLAAGGNAYRRAMNTLAELTYAHLRTDGDDAALPPPIYDQPWLLVPRLTLIGALVRFATLQTTLPAASRVRRTVIDSLERSLRLLDDAAHLIVQRAPIDGEALLRANIEADANETPSRGATTAAVVAVDKLPEAKAAIATTADAAAAAAPPGSAPSLPQSATVDVGEWLALQERLIAQLLGLASPVRTAIRPRLVSIAQSLLAYELDRLQPTADGSKLDGDEFRATLEPVLRGARFVFDRVLDADDGVLFEMGRSAVERELTDAALSGSQSPNLRALTPPQRELLRMLVVAETDRRILWRPVADGATLQQSTDRKNARNVELHVDASSQRVPFYQSWSVLAFSALEQSFRGGASPNPKQIIQCFIDDASNGDQVPVAVQRMVRVARAYLDARGRRSVVPGELQRYVPLHDAIDCVFTRPPKRKKASIGAAAAEDDDTEPAVRPAVDRYETPRVAVLHVLSQRHPLVPLLLAPLRNRFIVRILSETVTAGNKDVGLANGQLTLFGTKHDGTVLPRSYATGYDPEAFVAAIDAVRLGSDDDVLLVHEFTFAKAGGTKGTKMRSTDSYTTLSVVRAVAAADKQLTLLAVLNAARRQQYKVVSIKHAVPVPSLETEPWSSAGERDSASKQILLLNKSILSSPSATVAQPLASEQQTTTSSQVRARRVRRRTRRRVAFAAVATTNGTNGNSDDDDDDSSVSSSEPARYPIPNALRAKYSLEAPYVGSVLISSERESILVDTQLTPSGATRIGDWAYGQNVHTIWITRAHPDHMLGTALIISMLETRATVRVLARPDVVIALNARAAELSARAAALGFTRPLRLPQAYSDPTLHVGERDIIIQRVSGDGANIDVLLLPWKRAVIASDLVLDRMHPHLTQLAETAKLADWILSLRAMNRKHPRIVVPGHRKPGTGHNFENPLLRRQFRYLTRWQRAMRMHVHTDTSVAIEVRAARIVAYMDEKYDSYGDRELLLKSAAMK